MITKTVYANRSEWLAARNEKPVIGSSDVATIMGLNPYCTPYQYWLKLKDVRQFEEENERMLQGQYMEDAIAKLFEARTGERIIKRSSEIAVFRNDKYPDYVQVAPDRELFAKGRETRLIAEIKDTRLYITQDELDAGENLPASWHAQLTYQMGVMERSSAYLVVMNGNKELVYREFPFDPEYFAHIIEYCCEWFEAYILGNEIPPVETKEDVELRWPVSEPKSRKVVGDDIHKTYALLKDKKKVLKILVGQIDELENKLRIVFEDNEALTHNGNDIATYKTVIQSRIDTKRLKEDHPEIVEKYLSKTSFRQLRLK